MSQTVRAALGHPGVLWSALFAPSGKTLLTASDEVVVDQMLLRQRRTTHRQP
jgi:hypothetical protein